MRVATAAAIMLAPMLATSLAGAEEASQLPAPSLVLTVTPGAGGAPWTMKLANAGDAPVRVSADPRLLSFEITPPAGYIPADQWKKTKPTAAKPTKCALPDDARPRGEDGPDLVIPGGRSWSTSFDPLYYCFGVKERNLLVAGATVTPHFGFAPPKTVAGKKPAAVTAPFVASPVGAAVGKVTAVKEVVGASVTLADAALTKLPPLASAGATNTGTLEISVGETMDVGRGVELGTTITVANVSDRSQTFLFRHSTLGFTVQGPSGSVSCGNRRIVDGPIKELFTTLAPKGRTSTTLLVDAVCPPDTFDSPGIYRIVPRLDTTNASGRAIGLRTFEGVVEGTRPLLLRVRAPRRPQAAPPRPMLD